MADPTLYLFDGYNLLHAGPFADRRELVDALASFVATSGARGVVVFDGAGDDAEIGRLAVRFAPDADALLERLAAEHRGRERVLLVSSDATVLGTAGRRGREPLVADVLPRPPPGGGTAGAARRARRQARRGDAREARAPPPRAVGRCKRVQCKWACIFWRTLLDSPRPKGEGSLSRRRKQSRWTWGFTHECKNGSRAEDGGKGSTRA